MASALEYTALIFLLFMFSGTSWAKIQRPAKRLAPALIVFGDSTVDPGNNNNISTVLKANFLPYGRDFTGHRPTGRFSNGRLTTDFLAEGLGIKETVPAYLDPGLTPEDLLTGVSFASAGTGYDNRTAKAFSVIPIWKEVEYFKEYGQKLGKISGAENATRILNEAIVIVSMGSNDFLVNYYVNPYTRLQYNVAQFQDHLLQIGSNFLQEIYNYGARRILITGIPPLGCLPIERTVRNIYKQEQGCLQDLNQNAISYNIKIQKMIDFLRPKLPGIKIFYADIFSPLLNMVQNPAKYGFENTRAACCGTGLIEFSYICNRRNPLTCSDASKYIFWDAFHPTEKAYEIVAEDILKTSIRQVL
jgi:phospholipase/lecithinase/hemolysin